MEKDLFHVEMAANPIADDNNTQHTRHGLSYMINKL